MRLYSYWRSSCSYRVRIALNLKGIDYEIAPVHLVKGGGEQHSLDYVRLNPLHLVPTLEHAGKVITQSLAIIEYLEAIHPTPALLPKDAMSKVRALTLVHAVAIDIQPVNNLRVLEYLKTKLGADDETVKAWYQNWIAKGFAAVESLLVSGTETGRFCVGDAPTLADICLVPQVYNAERFACDLSSYPTIQRINESCLSIDSFRRAAPENQPDAPSC